MMKSTPLGVLFDAKNKKDYRIFDSLFWSCLAESNCRPLPYQGSALPSELRQQACLSFRTRLL